jgi:hypothetical protein
MDRDFSQRRYENLTPSGHMVLGEYNPLTHVFECHVRDKITGAKILLSEEAKQGITAALKAEDAAFANSDDSDDWSKIIKEAKMRQAAYLKQLVAVHADIEIERVLNDRRTKKELWRENRKLSQQLTGS